MCDNGASERHQNNALKAVIAYAKFLGENTTFYDINTKEQIAAYLEHLNTKYMIVKVVNESVVIINGQERDLQREAEQARRELRIAKGWDPWRVS
jgi:hypothetical protein